MDQEGWEDREDEVRPMRSRAQAGMVFAALAVAAIVSGVAPRAAQAQAPVPAAPADPKSDVPRLAMADFKVLLAAGHELVIDVRDSGSFKAGHIPGAINIVFEDFDKRAGQIKAKANGRAVVIYCSCPSEHASAVAARMLLDRGLVNVSALVGGYPEWVASGGRIER
jgi:rhodanese-related sulfurtransferase